MADTPTGVPVVADQRIKPVYLVGKILAIAGGIYALWQGGWNVHTDAAKVDIGVILGGIASLLENNPTANKIFGFVTTILNFMGINAPPAVTPDTTQPPPQSPKV
jgi:hypothetical protein